MFNWTGHWTNELLKSLSIFHRVYAIPFLICANDTHKLLPKRTQWASIYINFWSDRQHWLSILCCFNFSHSQFNYAIIAWFRNEWMWTTTAANCSINRSRFMRTIQWYNSTTMQTEYKRHEIYWLSWNDWRSNQYASPQSIQNNRFFPMTAARRTIRSGCQCASKI